MTIRGHDIKMRQVECVGPAVLEEVAHEKTVDQGEWFVRWFP